MNRRILVVDDDRDIAGLIVIYLRNEGFDADTAHDGEAALEKLEREDNYDLVILDIMMPKLDGLEVCRRIRRDRDIPILMVSAKAEDMDKIFGLMTGADDYLVKPFNPLELLARVKSLLRRSYQYNRSSAAVGNEDVIEAGPLRIDRRSHLVEADGKPVKLTTTEFGILALLAGSPGRVFSAEEIFQHVWKEKYFESNNTVMVHISKLRDKLEQDAGDKLITTVWGVGYKIDA